jgi:Berberine and berberine like
MDVFLFSFWLDENHRETARAYVADFDRLVGPLSNGHSYQNYPNPDNKGFGKMYFGGNLKRLVEVKGKYDPGDFFRFPQGLSGHR